MTAALIPFHQWKEAKRREMAPTVMPRDWYHTEYGRWCTKQRKNPKPTNPSA